MCALSPTYELHISLISCRKSEREGIPLFIALVRIHKYHILRDLKESYKVTLSFILKIYKNSEIIVELKSLRHST